MSEHKSVDGYPVEVDGQFWSNDLRVVKVTQVAAYANDYQGKATQTWHRTNQGDFDTLSGSLQPYGRLVRYYEGRDAEQFAPGASFSEIK
jgi:hypothetical protein